MNSSRTPSPLRLAIFDDSVYRLDATGVWVDRAFIRFASELSDRFDRVTFLGRVRRDRPTSYYRLPATVGFVALPDYPTLTDVGLVIKGLGQSLLRYWRLLDDVDVVWLMGPHPLALAFTALAGLRRRRIVLGVRQQLLEYVRGRHPGKRSTYFAAAALEATWRALARRMPVIAVGPAVAQDYAASQRLLEIAVSLVNESDLATEDDYVRRSYADERVILSVGRLETEKNPLLLSDVLEKLQERDGRCRLRVCGEGPLETDLRNALAARGLTESADLLGYVPLTNGLMDIYQSSHVFLHISWTEGLPQVLYEAFAARVPVVATDVGGIRAAVGDAALLVPAGDAHAASDAVWRVLTDETLRDRLVERGATLAASHTQRVVIDRVAAFIAGTA